ncbi:MAG: preprotein translocase subunit SecE [Methylococcaceae bacterium]|nr:preprotein translocase subunit SecE [Methylococcaceae bacterium]
MNAQTEAPASQILDIVKQVISVVFVVSGIAAFYYFSHILLLYRVLALLILMVLVLWLMFTTQIGQKTWAFILESKIEVRKVVWPTRDETMRTTLMVFVMVFIVGLVLWFLDMFLFWGIRLITGQGA